MPQDHVPSPACNVELKARARDPERLRAIAERLAGTTPLVLEQIDTFFHVPHGRLKLRQFCPDSGELISYERPDRSGPKTSDYIIVPTDEPAALRDMLQRALGIRGEVRKLRRVYIVGQARIHLDTVEGLGQFIEVEVVLKPGQSVSEGEAIAERLRHDFEVSPDDLVDRAYIDLLWPSATLLEATRPPT
jgi:predicted adenylyl cyclase CyaB